MAGKLPIGLQDFVGLRKDGYIYVDKTGYIYQLIHEGKQYFLSRPRRFGKSLLLSTMKAYWGGKKELFAGLKIEKLENGNPDAWEPYPVFYFDFNGVNYHEKGSLERAIDFRLQEWEEEYSSENNENTIAERFQKIMKKAYAQTGHRCVILVDEYDKPLLDVIEKKELQEHHKEVFKGFFSTLKSFDEYIRFVFITGVSKFHKVSIFSDLNQLNDISLDKKYAGICGITETELEENFHGNIASLADEQGMEQTECLAQLKQMYDGYHFYPVSEGVYNPYSLLKAFFSEDFGSYWFETGTPTFLIKKLREDRFDVRKFTDHTIYASEAALKDYTGDTLDSIPLLYQTGYLTIADYDRHRKRYTLAFPNEEVKYGFLESLVPSYVPNATAGHGLDIFTLDEYIENGRLDDIRDVLTGLFAGITYTLETDPFEHYFQAVIYLVFTLLGRFVLCEMHTYTGRIDCTVETEHFIYLFEFKCDETAEKALEQIEEKDYARPFVADSRKLYKIGVSFDTEKRKLADWKVAE
ncbi:MAG: ATP-binding protein [Lachnospiraceae bacterium]|nr:ATP-binding protein [Lachnospiraceae bacterium]